MAAQMGKTEILERLNLGSSVAENDDNLESYFVPTVALDDFLSDRYDLIRGAKGSGKSAILRMISRRGLLYTQLNDVHIVVATEHTGEPAFKRAFEKISLGEVTDEDLIKAWKIYLLNLAMDALDELPISDAKAEAIRQAENCGLRYRSTSMYRKILWSIVRILHPKSIGIGAEGGFKAEFPDAPPEFWSDKKGEIDFPEMLRVVAHVFEQENRRCWLLMDRLDAAFQAHPELERRALRSLLIAYKDFMGHRSFRIKLFFRTDLYDTVTRGAGFRELTHVADRASPSITWDPDKLLQMLMARFAFNESVCSRYGFSQSDMVDPEIRSAAFFSVFPSQIDVGKRKGDSWGWMCSRIRDGNGVRTPRDMHALVVNSVQKEREELALGRGIDSSELIGSAAVKAGFEALSKDKVVTTLIAENPELEKAIRAFTNQKAEQDSTTLTKLLGADQALIEHLVRIGFLEKLASSWKVPMLYRDGLDILQGAAFPKNESEDE